MGTSLAFTGSSQAGTAPRRALSRRTQENSWPSKSRVNTVTGLLDHKVPTRGSFSHRLRHGASPIPGSCDVGDAAALNSQGPVMGRQRGKKMVGSEPLKLQ